MAPKRKAPGGLAAPASPAKGELQLFAGCHMVFWDTHHTSVMQQRVKQLGATVQAALAPKGGTSHVICPANITPEQAAAKLALWTG